MSYCVIPGCKNPQNQNSDRFCQFCGAHLLLKERYRPVQPIGKGGFGRTFLAVDEHIPSQPNCVIKQLYFPEADTDTRKKVVALFRQEAIRLDELGQHLQIPQLLAHFEQERQLYLVQEFIKGPTLSQELRQNGTYSETQIWELLRDLLPVLEYIHNHNVIHRDIKPANIIRQVSNSGSKRLGNGQLVLLDFGIAKLFSDATLTKTGTIVGSPEYIAPEQLKGKTFPASDLYSLGVTCIYLLTGVPPLDMFDIIECQWAWRHFLPSGVNSVSDRLGQILDKLLQDSLKERYQSASDVYKNLNQLEHPSTVSPIQKRSARTSLGSEVGVDYRKLENLLATRRWKQADEETWAVMCEALGKRIGSYIFEGDIEKFPGDDLWTIDQLWLKYSGGRFGFSRQKQIYESLEGEYNQFCDRVGWPTHTPYVPDASLKFNANAPLGHLPSRRWVGGSQWWHHAAAMAARLEHCGIS